MNKNLSAVEINGKRYDLLTGNLIGSPVKSSRTLSTVAGANIDGFMRPPVIGKVKPSVVNKPVKRIVHGTGRKTQHSTTLMRKVVKKPTKPAIKHLAKARLLGRNSNRDNRARRTSRHPHVKHFGMLSAIKHRSRPSAVKEGEVLYRAQPAAKTTALTVPAANVMTNASHQRLERLLDYALAKADAHKKARGRAARGPAKLLKILPKWANVAVVVLLVASLAGLFVWSKLPQVSLKLAGTAAHVQASMPNYTPEGFAAVGPAKVQDGVVMMTYKATHDDSKSYVVKEQASNQDSSSVVANSVSPSAQVQTTQNRGVPISIIKQDGKNKAICSNAGRQITLEDHANLPPSVINDILSDVC